MFCSNFQSQIAYSCLMDQVKRQNAEWRDVRKSREYKIGMFVSETIRCVRHLELSHLVRKYREWWRGAFFAKKYVKVLSEKNYEPANYFLNDRIAVYTVIFGKYDKILEPYCQPDNVDYYLVTDLDVDLTNSKWKLKDISAFDERLSKLNNVEKNRFFKMHPHALFPEYKYTIYLDGNICPVSDLTELINRVHDCGLGAHMHSTRDCVFEEAKIAAAIGKDTKSNLERHVQYMKNNNMPEHYGMLECNVLARKNCDCCNKIMEMWWDEFCDHCKRDQISLPYVLYKLNIPVAEVATLGSNVYENAAIRVYTHI